MQSVKTLQTLNALVLFRCQLCDEGVRFLAEVECVLCIECVLYIVCVLCIECVLYLASLVMRA
jgi:hypothetical protein